MSFFITEEQQNKIDDWLDEQNKLAIDKIINDENTTEELKSELIDNRERGLEVPPHDQNYGYYSISFTPTPYGNRIYVHHHINNVSYKIFDIGDPISDVIE